MAEPSTIYKVTILYMLNRADFPLSNTQFVDFFLEHNYTDYFQVQNALQDLLDSELIISKHTHSNLQYFLTDKGRESLDFFQSKISDGIVTDVADFFQTHDIAIRRAASITSDYFPAANGAYQVRCQATADGKPVIDLTLTVPGRTQAQTVCANWNRDAEEIYTYLLEQLIP